MPNLKPEYLEKIYAGWLAKIIGIRLGAPIEGWTYERIKKEYGEVHDYLISGNKCFAADDDSNGPIFFLRALEDGKSGFDLTAQDVGEALLNYAPFEHGFFWWGGYGISTEHTAYLNLRSGIPAPRSGSITQNGTTVAEQIGGQIFIDSWGLVTPGNPDLAAKYAKEAASVTHGGNGVYGGVFIAVCISHAFQETNIHKIIEKGLSYIPSDCEYTRVVRAVMAFHEKTPSNWRDCYNYIFENFGYDRYPGNCHIIPNTAVMVLSLLYGDGDFSNTINICNMCGWDTDCNVGNIATIMGVVCGLEGIDYEKWRAPINDLLICSSVMGALNIMDIPYGASYIAKLAWAIAGEALPSPWDEIVNSGIDSCHFEYPGSTHVMGVRQCHGEMAEYRLLNTDEAANSGSRSLKVEMKPTGRAYVYKKTYYVPEDFHDSRYDPSFSPLVYPGQTVNGSVMLPQGSADCTVRLYVRNAATGEIIEGEAVIPPKGRWENLAFTIPRIEAGLIDEAGFIFELCNAQDTQVDCFIDDFFFSGRPDYSIDFAQSREEVWHFRHKAVSQFTRLKGLMYLDGGKMHLSCHDFGEAYTGHHNWTDYTAVFSMTPLTGEYHLVNVRVQGAIRSYGAGFFEKGKIGLFKNENGYRKLVSADFEWEHGREYTIAVAIEGPKLVVAVDGVEMLSFTDDDAPYLQGGIGVAVRDGGHAMYGGVSVCPGIGFRML
ncbi:MAG: ADP-ribosylglycohydrolase family protein [Defluviitaleaceae bacterium]|nr:ADP-ribosylglycohydrolase family protein [Defluviitaleaceae bacterium]